MLSESNIIAYLKHAFPEQIGDDAAIFPLSDTQSYVITQDLLVEEVHFNLNYFDPASLAHKALHVNLSDIAAMGASPQFVLLALAIPTRYETQLQPFLQAFTSNCQHASILLMGGDTTRSPDKLLITVTIIGIAQHTQITYRHGACPNDQVYLVGNLGFAHLGLQAFESNHAGLEPFKQICLKPTARLKEGLWLAKQAGVQAMMDVSDGLLIDLKRLCEASSVACEINLDHLKTEPEFEAACHKLHLDPLVTQLTGGEDYGLLVALDSRHIARITTEFKTAFGYSLSPIGLLKQGHGVSFLKSGKPELLTLTPFSHFGELL